MIEYTKKIFPKSRRYKQITRARGFRRIKRKGKPRIKIIRKPIRFPSGAKTYIKRDAYGQIHGYTAKKWR